MGADTAIGISDLEDVETVREHGNVNVWFPGRLQDFPACDIKNPDAIDSFWIGGLNRKVVMNCVRVGVEDYLTVVVKCNALYSAVREGAVEIDHFEAV